MTDTKYNGWTNYATWRVNLEWFDGADWNDYYIGSFPEPHDLGQALHEFVEDTLSMKGDGTTLDYALAFINDVNWYEIAQHLLESEES